MYTTLYMGLTAWDQPGDQYDHSQLSNNFVAIAGHRHVPGEGRRIPSDGLEDASVTTSKLAPDSVTPDKIPNNSLTDQELADNSVGRRHLQDNAVGAAEVENGSIGFSELDPRVVPIGKIIMWYRPNGSVALPLGWEVCDGRAWNTVPNAWGLTSGNMPDFRNAVPLGAALAGVGSGPNDPPDIGQIGGAFTIDLTHGHTVDAHTHQVGDHAHTIAAHTHPITADGLHNHLIAGGILHSRRNAFLQDIEVQSWDSSNNPIRRQNSEQSLYVAGFNTGNLDAVANVDDAGLHNHGGQTGSAGGGLTGGAGTLTTGTANTNGTSSALGVVTVKPKYVGVLFLIRVL